MSRQIIRGAVVSVISACALMLMPASSFAESLSNCTKICIETPQAVEVVASSAFIEEIEFKSIEAPLLPKQARSLRSTEHHYFYLLYSIAGEICDQVSYYPYTEIRTTVGFSKQLTQFKIIRELLNGLLHHYKLGYAPDLEDFSHVSDLEYVLPSEWIKVSNHLEQIRSVEDAGSSESSRNCAFKIVSSMR